MGRGRRSTTTGETRSVGGHSEPGDHAIGRSRGGPTTEIHLACDGHGRPLSVALTGGNVHDCPMFTQVMAGIEFRRSGPDLRRTGRAVCWRTRATPAGQPAATRPGRRAPTGFRPHRLLASQAVPCDRHAVRQDRYLLPRHDRSGDAAQPALRTGPSGGRFRGRSPSRRGWSAGSRSPCR
ncbi:transposase [Amycolatopsis sp. Hca4]|nr:transposase [Amycolatopsis sp. Hca4]